MINSAPLGISMINTALTAANGDESPELIIEDGSDAELIIEDGSDAELIIEKRHLTT